MSKINFRRIYQEKSEVITLVKIDRSHLLNSCGNQEYVCSGPYSDCKICIRSWDANPSPNINNPDNYQPSEYKRK